MSHYGVDLSTNNGPVDFAALHTSLTELGDGGEPFVILKVSEGVTYVNPALASWVKAARAAGFRALAGYLFDHGRDSPIAEQATYHRVAAGLPEVLDDETPDGDSPAAYAVHARELAGAAPFALAYLNEGQALAGMPRGCGLYLAYYNGIPGDTPQPALIHQYTSVAAVHGIVGHADMDYWSGTEAQFNEFFGLTPTPAPVLEDDDMIQLAPGDKHVYPARPAPWTLLFGYDDAGGPAGTGVMLRVAIGTTTPGPWNDVPVWGGKDFAFWVPIGVPVTVPVAAGQLVSIVNTGADSVGIDRVL